LLPDCGQGARMRLRPVRLGSAGLSTLPRAADWHSALSRPDLCEGGKIGGTAGSAFRRIIFHNFSANIRGISAETEGVRSAFLMGMILAAAIDPRVRGAIFCFRDGREKQDSRICRPPPRSRPPGLLRANSGYPRFSPSRF